MSLATVGFWVISLWLVVYAVKYSRRRPKVLLPLSQSRKPTTEVTVKHLHIRLKTDAFNSLHNRLSTQLSPNKSRVLRQVLLRSYDLGSFVGAIGMVLGFLLLFFTVASLSSELLYAWREDHHSANRVVKRDVDYLGDTTPPAYDSLRISPIIPGLTVPLTHLPLILVALVISHLVHEAGHAITAALHHVPMLSCGVTVTFFLPSAFVTLPAARLDKLPPRDRLQIVSSGCFHNFLLSCLLFSAAWTKTGILPTWILFQDVSALGKIVVGIDHDSPLAAHIPVGALITKVDDISMASESLNDPWDRYLLSASSDSFQGWCTNKSFLNEALAPACANIGPYSCFMSVADETEQYELDPVTIFTDSRTRCNSSVECSSLSSCVIPRRDQRLVRISVLEIRGATSTVVWKGPKEEIWEQVQVGNLRPRFSFVSYKLPEVASAFFEYMKIANLSLYILNMLPITMLDGYQLLVALLQLLYGRVNDGLEVIDPEGLNLSRFSRKHGVHRVCIAALSFLALLLVALCGLLGAISWVVNR